MKKDGNDMLQENINQRETGNRSTAGGQNQQVHKSTAALVSL